MKATGGKSIYGASVGILMLDAQFPRIPGDVGNALTWRFPVHYKIVRGASPDLIVRRGAEGMLDPFIEAARDLVRDGVDGITTNCGFLSLFQEELASAVGVPVASSSLMQIAMVNRCLPHGKRAGVLTISASTLTREHLERSGAPVDTPVAGTENGVEFSRVILGDLPEMDVELARKRQCRGRAAIGPGQSRPWCNRFRVYEHVPLCIGHFRCDGFADLFHDQFRRVVSVRFVSAPVLAHRSGQVFSLADACCYERRVCRDVSASRMMKLGPAAEVQ